MDVLSGKLTISSGGNVVLIDKTIVTNGEYKALYDHADGYKNVTVALPLGTKSITQNGTYNASSENYQGYSSVNVNVQPTLGTKSITVNGTYNASSDNVDGFSQVIVNVDTAVKNPNYRWWTNSDKTLVVREKISDGSFRWYFNLFNVYSRTNTPVPSNLTNYIKNNCAVTCNEAHPDGGSAGTQYAIGFASNCIRTWNLPNGTNNYTGYFSGILESTMGTGFNPMQTWVDPSYDPING